ncbi:hypothetical protein ACIBCM_06890 [Streptomyces sp. NPDC051018]|uniref:hypothetical protein n=1 Tax=Streptomyces sp. NPDC051018 TaxID=3365639 RepID=UPI00378EAC60
MVLGLVTLLVSVAALAISTGLALRQLVSAKRANVLSMVLEAFREVRDEDYLAAVD